MISGSLSSGITAAFDCQKLELTLSATRPLPQCESVPVVNADFFGKKRKAANPVPGPFNHIPSGPTKFRLWRGPAPGLDPNPMKH